MGFTRPPNQGQPLHTQHQLSAQVTTASPMTPSVGADCACYCCYCCYCSLCSNTVYTVLYVHVTTPPPMNSGDAMKAPCKPHRTPPMHTCACTQSLTHSLTCLVACLQAALLGTQQGLLGHRHAHTHKAGEWPHNQQQLLHTIQAHVCSK